MLKRSVLAVVLLLPVCGMAWAAEPAAGAQQQAQPFAAPFSRNMQIISESDEFGLGQFGHFGLTERVVKPVPGMAAQNYQSFDESMVVTVNAGGKIAPATLDFIRGLVRDQVRQANFTVAPPDRSQAGIASILSTFRTAGGQITTELLVVVFDRAKMRALQQANPELRGLDAIFQAAIRAMVSHLYPATQLDLLHGAEAGATRDGLQILFKRCFSHFMEPASAGPENPS